LDYHDAYNFLLTVSTQLRTFFQQPQQQQQQLPPLKPSQFMQESTPTQKTAIKQLQNQLARPEYTQIQLSGHTGSGKTRVVIAALLEHLHHVNKTPPAPWMRKNQKQMNVCSIACTTIKLVEQWYAAIQGALAQSPLQTSTRVLYFYNHQAMCSSSNG
jgi:superfamily II DNA or RNA helicase